MKKKNVVVVLNGISLRKKEFYKKFLPLLSEVANVEVKETLTKNDAVSLASKAAEQYVDLVIAAGGDGTLNQVVNGILTGRENASKLPVIGLIPLGSGNDFARTALIKSDVTQIKNLVAQFVPKKIDVGSIQFTNAQTSKQELRFFVNMADMGMGPIVVDKVLKSGRAFGHAAAYYKSIIATFFQYKLVEVEARSSEWSWKGKLRTLGVGNGKYYGHGMAIAPDAILNDRLFNVFICGNVSVLDFIRFSGRLRNAKRVNLPEIHYKTATEITFTSISECLIEGDGEIFGTLPATVRLLDRQLDFLI